MHDAFSRVMSLVGAMVLNIYRHAPAPPCD